jgi:SAM-dependent methyltransferase
MRRAAAALRKSFMQLVFGFDVRAEVRSLDAKIAALHIAISDAMLDLSEESKDSIKYHMQQSVHDILIRTDLLVERVDRKTEGFFSSVSRRLDQLPDAPAPANGDFLVKRPVTHHRKVEPTFSDDAYLLFEEEFRGSEEETREKLRGYAGFFQSGPVVDIGCGRGEMIELLGEEGIEAYGIDSNSAMVQLCRTKSLKVFEADLFEHLGELESASLGGVIANQVIEHLSPDEVLQLLRLAFRALNEGGRIVLETPNPTSLFALSQNWVRDPTHVWAVHPDTLRFMASLAGFNIREVRFGSPVQPEDRLEVAGLNDEKLNHLIYGPQDFALLAEKPSHEDRMG